LPAAWGWDVPVVSTPDGLPWIGPHRNYRFTFLPWHSVGMEMGWHGSRRARRCDFCAASRRETTTRSGSYGICDAGRAGTV
jgi:hypothetical protein